MATDTIRRCWLCWRGLLTGKQCPNVHCPSRQAHYSRKGRL